jgi:hypothetical protein
MFGRKLQLAGPVGMPVNALLIRALMSFYLYYGDNFKIECPTGTGKLMNVFEVAREISNRFARIFLRNQSGPVRSTEAPRNFRPILTGRITFYSMNSSTEITARPWS